MNRPQAPYSETQTFIVWPRYIAGPTCPSTDDIDGIESDDNKACCVASCGQCGGVGCAEAGEASDCCALDIVEDGDPCSETGAAPCYIDDGEDIVSIHMLQ